MTQHSTQYPPAVGRKFNADGSVRYYPGNTFVCPVPRSSDFYAAMLEYRAEIQAAPFAHRLSFLPPQSYHMTVFEGATDQIRTPGHWPADLWGASMDECTAIFKERLKSFHSSLSAPVRMRVGGLSPLSRSVMLVPDDARQNRALRQLRDALSELTGIRHEDHDSYAFHCSVHYLITWMTPEEEGLLWPTYMPALRRLVEQVKVLELGMPEFCTFENMFHFEPQLELKG